MQFRPAWPGQIASLGYQLVEDIEADLGVTLTDEQADRIVDYYAIDSRTGARLVRRAAVRRPKGSGKSPEGAWCAYAELVLATVFVGWDDDRQPMARPHHDPWIQLAAVSIDQTVNVMGWLFDVLTARPEVCALRGIDLGRTRIYLKGRPGRIEPVTASAGSREGQRLTFAVLDQSESWFEENGGDRLADVLRRNTAKMGGWSLELQNAPAIGDGSVADRTASAAEKRAKGVLYDTREPPGHDQIDMEDRDQLAEAITFAYGDSVQFLAGGVERLVDEILDPETDPGDAMRYYLNVAAPSSDWAFDHSRWKALGGVPVPKDGSTIVAGFDGARHHDAVSLIGCEVETGIMWNLATWERPAKADDDYEHPETEVSQAVADMFDQFRVWRLYCDPPYWDATIAAWAGKHKGFDRKPAVVNWWTNRWRPIGYACKALATSIRAGEVMHVDTDDRDVLSIHMRNAVKRTVNARDEQGRQLWTLAKPAPGRKIDAAMAAVLAWEARRDAVASGVKHRRRSVAAY